MTIICPDSRLRANYVGKKAILMSMFFNFANLITKSNQNEKNSTDIIVGLCFYIYM